MVNLSESLRTNGFEVVSGVLDASEIERLRVVASGHLRRRSVPFSSGSTQPNAAVEVLGLAWLFAHHQVLSVFRSAVAPDSLMFTSHCDVHLNVLGGWHKDSGDHIPGSYFGVDPYSSDRIRVYKAAFYLQDHADNDGALWVKPGSHRTSSIEDGERLVLHPGVGDMVLFDVRLTHSGEQASRMERRMNRVIERVPGAAGRADVAVRSAKLKAAGRPARYSIFFTFGAANELTEQFAIRSMRRQLEQYPSTSTHLSPDLRAALLAGGVALAEDAVGWPECR